MPSFYTPLKARSLYLAIIAGLLALLVISNMYWYFKISESATPNNTNTSSCREIEKLLATVSKKYEKLLTNTTALESKYRELLTAYNFLLEKINESKTLIEKMAIRDAYYSLNKTVSLLLNETLARTTIGRHLQLFMTPSQLLDTVISITGSLYNEERAIMDLTKIYNWVSKNITTITDQPFLRLRLLYLKVDNKKFAANITYEYTDRFIQTDIETLDRRAGDLLDKTILLTSLVQEYLQEAHGEGLLLYTKLGQAQLFSTLVIVKIGEKKEYLIMDLSTKIYGPYTDVSRAISKWLEEYHASPTNIGVVYLVNNRHYFEGKINDLIDWIKNL